MSAPTIRLAGPGDGPALHAALGRLMTHLGEAAHFRATAGDYERHGFGETPLFRALLAEAGGEVCGAATFFPEFSTLRGRPGVYLQDLWVSGRFRGGGLGRRLLSAVSREAGGWGAAYMKLAVHTDNPTAIAFYGRLGFAVDEVRNFVIEGERFATLKGRT